MSRTAFRRTGISAVACLAVLATAGGPAWSQTMPSPSAADHGRVFNVRDYGATGDGTTTFVDDVGTA